VPLRAAVLPARGTRRRAPVVALSGGPGQAARDAVGEFAAVLRAGRAGRDVVAFDQRGTGRSGLLRCPAFERALRGSYEASAGSCGVRLGVRRSFYTSADSAADLDAVRAAIGAPRIVVYGVSYGTRVALEYARRFPGRTEALVLDSSVPPEGPDPFALSTLREVPRVLRAACRYGCGGAERHPIADLRRLTAELRRTPIRRRVRVGDGRELVTVGADDLLGTLITGDIFPPLLQEAPAAVRDALRGRTGRLARLVWLARELDDLGSVREFSPGLFAATLCEESPVAWDRAAPPAERERQARAALAAVPEAGLAPFDREAAVAFGLLPLCVDWPAPARPVPPAPALPDVPALVLSGELDLRTPLEDARRVVAALPRARLVRQPGVGHAVVFADPEACAARATAAFLRGAGPPRCAAGSARSAWSARLARRGPMPLMARP
jgi:pimeloyl-ACP methyl ester carboxylesterase